MIPNNQFFYNNGVSVLPILNLFPGAQAAYGLRKLRSAYSGNCIRVRRTDNATQDIGFIGNVLDTASILSFCGGGNGFISIWYDQSGNGLNLSNGTTAAHPQLVASGSMITVSSRYSAKFPTATISLKGSAASDWKFMHYTDYSIYMTIQAGLIANPNAEYGIMGTNNGTSAATGFFLDWIDNAGNDERVWHQVTNSSGSGATGPINNFGSNNVLPANVLKVLSVIADPTNVTANQRSFLSVSKSPAVNLNAATGAVDNTNPPFALQLGGFGNSGGSFIGYVSELIIYPTKQTANDAGIQENLLSYYGLPAYP